MKVLGIYHFGYLLTLFVVLCCGLNFQRDFWPTITGDEEEVDGCELEEEMDNN